MVRTAVALLVATFLSTVAAIEDNKTLTGPEPERDALSVTSKESAHQIDVEVAQRGAVIGQGRPTPLTFLTVLTDPQGNRLYASNTPDMAAVNVAFSSARQHHEKDHELRLVVLSDEVTIFGSFGDSAVKVLRVRGGGTLHSVTGVARAVAHFLFHSVDSGDLSHVVVLSPRILLLDNVSSVFDEGASFDIGLTYRDAPTQVDDAVMFIHGSGKEAAARYLSSMAHFARHSGTFTGVGRRPKPPAVISTAERMSDSVAGFCQTIAEVPVGTPLRRVVHITNCLHFGVKGETSGSADQPHEPKLVRVDDIVDVRFNGTRIRLLPCEDYNWSFRGMRKHIHDDTVPKALQFEERWAAHAVSLAADVVAEDSAESALEAKWAVFNLLEETPELTYDMCSDLACAARCAYFQASGVPPTFECAFLPSDLLEHVHPSSPPPAPSSTPHCVQETEGSGETLCQGREDGPSKGRTVKPEKAPVTAWKTEIEAAQLWREQLTSPRWAASEVARAQYYQRSNGHSRPPPRPRLTRKLLPMYLVAALVAFIAFALFRIHGRYMRGRKDRITP